MGEDINQDKDLYEMKRDIIFGVSSNDNKKGMFCFIENLFKFLFFFKV